MGLAAVDWEVLQARAALAVLVGAVVAALGQ
jgi:hypothetical protein